MSTPEDPSIPVSEIILDAVTLSQAVLNGDIDEVRFRARLIASKAASVLMLDVIVAATRVIELLKPGSTAPATLHTRAIEALFLAIDQAATLPQPTPANFPPSVT